MIKKSVFAIVLVIAVILSAAASTLICNLTLKSEKTASENLQPAGNAESTDPEKQEVDNLSEKTPKNVYYSPFTGSDDSDGLSIGTPVETLQKAKEIADGLTLAENEEAVILEYLMTVNVKTMQSYGVNSPAGGVNMIPFTGSTEGHWFTGEIQGQGCDTQKYPPEGGAMFSARYLLKGVDCDGKNCSVFIENNGPALELCTPTVITDSSALSDWQRWNLRAIVVPVAGGVDVNVFRIEG